MTLVFAFTPVTFHKLILGKKKPFGWLAGNNYIIYTKLSQMCYLIIIKSQIITNMSDHYHSCLNWTVMIITTCQHTVMSCYFWCLPFPYLAFAKGALSNKVLRNAVCCLPRLDRNHTCSVLQLKVPNPIFHIKNNQRRSYLLKY